MQNISLIGTVVLEKKSFERFFTIYGHGGHLEFRKILAILYSKVPHMLHAKYQPNWHSSSGEEVI